MTAKTLTAEEARAAADEAAETVRDLEKRLRTGDTSVTADQLAQARLAAEHAELVVEGAKAVEARARAQEIADAGEALHRRFSADMEEAVTEANKRIDALQDAFVAALAALDALGSTREAARAEWRTLFQGVEPDNPLRLRFLAGGRPAGEFGQTDTVGVVTRVDAVQALVAAIGEAVRGRDRGRINAVDRHWIDQLNAGPVGADYRLLRSIRKETDK